MRRLLSYYLPSAPKVFIYMLQQVEYRPRHFAMWLRHIPVTTDVIKRQKLVMTTKSKLLLFVAYGSWCLPLFLGLFFVWGGSPIIGVTIATAAPFISILTLLVVTGLAQMILVQPLQIREIERARKKINRMRATKIAVIGSYGKTTMKDILQSVLKEGKKVAATPGNKNVLISHTRWIINSLKGTEEVLIFEYGEAQPGDINRLASLSKPDFAVITGLAPAHLEDYISLDAVAADFKEVQHHVTSGNQYINAESTELIARISGPNTYSIDGVNGWKVSAISASLEGLAFTLTKAKHSIRLRSRLVGLHQIGPLSAAVDIAFNLGLSDKQIQAGVAETRPFKHRMQPYKIGEAWIVDDTYNGNIEGMKAGLRLLSELETKGRKIYVTPGLVEQGSLKQTIHEELGRLIAIANPSRVVLMKNSATYFIQTGLDQGGYKGELLVESDPLNFYTNLEHFIADGDIVLMQNDWTDNYL